MTSQAAVLAVLTSEWQSTPEIARLVPDSCSSFSIRRSNVNAKLNTLHKQGIVEKKAGAHVSMWRLKP